MTDAFALTNPAMATAAGVEILLTFLLTFVIFGTMIDPRTPRVGGMFVGLTLIALSFVGFRLTGAALNPARSFGLFVWELTTSRPLDWRVHLLVYWIAPIVGALLAGLVYTYLILPAEARTGELPLPAPVAKTKK